MSLWREVLLLVAVAMLPAGLSVALHPDLADRSRAGLPPDAVRIGEVQGWEEPVLWVDARTPEAFARGHIPGALLVPEDTFDTSLGTVLLAWSPGSRIVVYCDSTTCTRSRDFAARLREAGLEGVHYLHGGWEAWQATQPPP